MSKNLKLTEVQVVNGENPDQFSKQNVTGIRYRGSDSETGSVTDTNSINSNADAAIAVDVSNIKKENIEIEQSIPKKKKKVVASQPKTTWSEPTVSVAANPEGNNVQNQPLNFGKQTTSQEYVQNSNGNQPFQSSGGYSTLPVSQPLHKLPSAPAQQAFRDQMSRPPPPVAFMSHPDTPLYPLNPVTTNPVAQSPVMKTPRSAMKGPRPQPLPPGVQPEDYYIVVDEYAGQNTGYIRYENDYFEGSAEDKQKREEMKEASQVLGSKPVIAKNYCTLCGIQSESTDAYFKHMSSLMHKEKIRRQMMGSGILSKTEVVNVEEDAKEEEEEEEEEEDDDDDEDWHRCEHCKTNFDTPETYFRHTRGLIHIQKVMEADNPEIKEQVQPEEDWRIKVKAARETAALIKDDPCLAEPFYCDICNVKCTSTTTFEQHIIGNKHKKNLFNGGRYARVAMLTHQDIQSGHQRISDMKTFIEGSPDALVGLQYIIEFQSKNEDVLTRYVCSLCEAKCDGNTIRSHLIGQKHRDQYFRKYYPDMHSQSKRAGDKKSDQSTKYDFFARQIEASEGRADITVVEDSEDFDLALTMTKLNALTKKELKTVLQATPDGDGLLPASVARKRLGDSAEEYMAGGKFGKPAYGPPPGPTFPGRFPHGFPGIELEDVSGPPPYNAPPGFKQGPPPSDKPQPLMGSDFIHGPPPSSDINMRPLIDKGPGFIKRLPRGNKHSEFIQGPPPDMNVSGARQVESIDYGHGKSDQASDSPNQAVNVRSDRPPSLMDMSVSAPPGLLGLDFDDDDDDLDPDERAEMYSYHEPAMTPDVPDPSHSLMQPQVPILRPPLQGPSGLRPQHAPPPLPFGAPQQLGMQPPIKLAQPQQQQRMPAQGHTNQIMPSQGSPQQEMPSQRHPNEEMSSQHHPNQGQSQRQGIANQGHSNQAMPPRGHQQGIMPQDRLNHDLLSPAHKQQGMSGPGHSQGMPSQGHQQQGMPSQGHQQQGMPSQDHSQQGMPQHGSRQQQQQQQQQGQASGILDQKRGMPGQNQEMPGQNQGMPGQNQGMPGQNQGIPGQNQRMAGQNQGMPGQNQGMPGQNQGIPRQSQGMSGQHQGMPRQNQGMLGQNQEMLGQDQGMSGQNNGMSARNQEMSGPNQGMSGQNQRMPRQNQGMPGQNNGMPGQNQGLPGPNQGMSGQNQGMLGPNQGMPGQNQGMPGQNQGMPGQNQGMPGQNQGMPGQNQGMPGQNQGMPGQNQGMPGQNQGMPGHDQGMSGQNEGMPDPGAGMPGMSDIMHNLSTCLVSNEEEAELALQVSNALTQALLQYRLSGLPPDLSDISKTAAALGAGKSKQGSPSMGQQPFHHGQSQSNHPQQASHHEQSQPNHVQQPPHHGHSQLGHGQQPSHHGQSPGSHGQPQPHHGQSQRDHGQPQPHHGQSHVNQGQQPQQHHRHAPQGNGETFSRHPQMSSNSQLPRQQRDHRQGQQQQHDREQPQQSAPLIPQGYDQHKGSHGQGRHMQQKDSSFPNQPPLPGYGQNKPPLPPEPFPQKPPPPTR